MQQFWHYEQSFVKVKSPVHLISIYYCLVCFFLVSTLFSMFSQCHTLETGIPLSKLLLPSTRTVDMSTWPVLCVFMHREVTTGAILALADESGVDLMLCVCWCVWPCWPQASLPPQQLSQVRECGSGRRSLYWMWWVLRVIAMITATTTTK